MIRNRNSSTPKFKIKTLQNDINCVAIQDPSAVWGLQDFLPRRNLLTYSEDVSNASAWAASGTAGVVYPADLITSPSGAVLKKIDSDSSTGYHRNAQSVTAPATKLSYSIEAKSDEISWIWIMIYDSATVARAYFDLSNGSVGTVTHGTASITSLGSGVYRCKITGTVKSTSVRVFNALTTADNNEGVSTAGTAGNGAYFGRAQLTRADTIDQSYQHITDWVSEQYAWAAQKQVPWLRRNRFLNTATLSTQTVSSVTASPITASFKGTGTITFSTAYSGSLVGTGENDRVTATFTPTAGNLVCTVTGTVTEAQCENGTTATEYQPILASWDATYTANAIAAGYQISLWQDSAGTTAVNGDNQPIGKMLDMKGAYTATQATTANQPKWRLDSNNKPYIERDLVNDSLPITLPNLGSNCVIYTAEGNVTIKDSGITLNGSYAPITPAADYGRIIMAADSRYDAKIIKYLDQKRGRVSSFGPQIMSDTGFNGSGAWILGGGWSVSGGTGIATNAPYATAIGQSSATIGKTYVVQFTIVSISAGSVCARAGGKNGATRTSAGTYCDVLTATTIGLFGVFVPVTTTTCVIDNISVREVIIT